MFPMLQRQQDLSGDNQVGLYISIYKSSFMVYSLLLSVDAFAKNNPEKGSPALKY